MLKVESRSPLTFSPLTLDKPQREMALRVIAGSLMKHQDRDETIAIWNAIKKARTAQSERVVVIRSRSDRQIQDTA